MLNRCASALVTTFVTIKRFKIKSNAVHKNILISHLKIWNTKKPGYLLPPGFFELKRASSPHKSVLDECARTIITTFFAFDNNDVLSDDVHGNS
jgi:hypothetical protein